VIRGLVLLSMKFRVLVVGAAVLVLGLGITQVRNASVDVLPEFAPPQVEIQTIALGNSSTEVEELITVPIEVGPSLVGKQVGRYLAGLRRPYGYERYRLPELFSAAVLWNARAFASSHTQLDATGTGHKGFDFRDIERALRQRMDIERTVFSPFPPLGPLLNSTVMWRCRTRSAAAAA